MITDYNYDDTNYYDRVNISRKDHNILFPYRRLGAIKKAKYYLKKDEDKFVLVIGANFLGKAYATFLVPLAIILNGVANTKEISQEWLSIIKNDCNTYDDISSGELFDRVMECIY